MKGGFKMEALVSKLHEIGIVPVIKIDDAANAVPLAKALIEGGLPCAEVTFRTAAAKDAIARISKEFPDMLVGAGTVLTTAQVDEAVEAGAKFIVAPGLNPNIVKYCQKIGIPMMPGTANPSDVEAALELGLKYLKFFPAEINGGINAINAIAAPYTDIKFMPTGGVNEKNLGDYMKSDKIIACGGSWMVSADLIENGEFDKITELCKEAVAKSHNFEVAHVGINSDNEEEALKAANMLTKLFHFPANIGNSSIFSTPYIEIMKTPFYGKNGHIAIRVNSVDRAIPYLKNLGIEVIEESKKFANGRCIVVYLKEEIAGFAFHLVNR